MPKQLRLLLFEECNRRCKGCCNKQWNLPALPVCRDYSNYTTVMLTGGEPLLKPALVLRVIEDIRRVHAGSIWVYTAKVDEPSEALAVLAASDGLCITLHVQGDVQPLENFLQAAPAGAFVGKSMRLNAFRGVTWDRPLPDWFVKTGIIWQKDCHLPASEVFMRLEA